MAKRITITDEQMEKMLKCGYLEPCTVQYFMSDPWQLALRRVDNEWRVVVGKEDSNSWTEELSNESYESWKSNIDMFISSGETCSRSQ